MIKGLYNKYTVINNSTGKQVSGCFVLRPESDLAALEALRTYANSTSDVKLANDLLEWIGLIEKKWMERR